MVQDPAFFPAAEVDLLVGEGTKPRTTLGWAPQVGFTQLVKIMVDADLAREVGARQLMRNPRSP